MSEWQPIETAPIWQLVIIYDQDAFPYKSSKKVYTAVQTEYGKWELGNKPVKNPTHWQPLPEPPASAIILE